MRVDASGADDLDLTAAANKVADAATPHKTQAPPSLAIVLFAKLDKDSAKKAETALGKVKGVDGKDTKANAEKGEISVAFKGKDKVTANDLVGALKAEGIMATTTKK